MERNRLWLLFKSLKKRTLLLILPALLLTEAAVFLFSLARGWGGRKIMSWLFFLNPGHWALLGESRREMRQLRILRERSLVQLFSAKLDSPDLDSPVVKYVFNPLMGIYWKVIKILIRW
jgi:hypothetical protein